MLPHRLGHEGGELGMDGVVVFPKCRVVAVGGGEADALRAGRRPEILDVFPPVWHERLRLGRGRAARDRRDKLGVDRVALVGDARLFRRRAGGVFFLLGADGFRVPAFGGLVGVVFFFLGLEGGEELFRAHGFFSV